MKFMPCFSFLLLCFYNVNCSVYSEVADENLPFSYQPSGWQKVFEKMLEKKRSLPFPFFTSKDDFALCAICDAAITAILTERGFDMTKVQLEAQLQYFCSTFLEIEDDTVCEGIIDVNADTVLYILDNTKETLGSTQICSQLLDCDVGSDYFDWSIGDLKGKTVEKVESTGEKTFKIAHITDIHYDPNYTEGKVFDCGEPMCCQPDQPDATGNQTACGRWSSFKNADSPLRLLNAAIDGINEQEYDYVYFTGDMVAQRVWNTSQEYNKKTITEAMDLFAKKFKKPVIPVLGNHETHPVNLYAPLNITDDSLNQKWLFETIFDKWSKWLDEEAKETIKKGGYYSILLEEGFRVIVLNNNVAQKENWWNLYVNEDPYGQLKWLAQTLEKAESNGEIVHILSHIPSSHCMKVWSREYNKIIERFSNTIAAQFNGHTHKDQFSIYYDSKNVSNNMVINGASLMPDRSNPNFKIYTVDSKGYDIMDAEVYTFDLEEANKDNNETIKWEKLYSFVDKFSVSKLVPSELEALVKRMVEGIKKKNYTLINLYHNFYYRNSKTSQDTCDEACQQKYICEILTTVYGETSMCDDLWM